MAERIRWQETPLGMIDGHVGTVEACLFSVWQPPQASGEWVLTTQLPGMESVRRYGDGPGDLKPEAERLLSAFAASLGALFPGTADAATAARGEQGHEAALSRVVTFDMADGELRLVLTEALREWARLQRACAEVDGGDELRERRAALADQARAKAGA
jgi:hypothetical protein